MPALADIPVDEIERALVRLRADSAAAAATPDLRMSTMTHLAWAPEEWYEQVVATLRGMGDRHPSRTIVLVPEPNAGENGIDAELDLERFPLANAGRSICAEVIVLRLKGTCAHEPASIVQPLLISDLPVFLRWRGEPPWSTPPFERLVDLVDRLVVDSSEWDDLPYAYGKLAPVFDRAVVSDLAWARTLGWRRALAELWPGIAAARRLRVGGPYACALLLQGWLQAALGNPIELEHDDAGRLESVSVDGQPVRAAVESASGSDLLSDELDRETRDRAYESAVRSSAP